MKWVFPEQKPSDVLGFLLAQRDINDPDEFLNPSLDQIHSASELHDVSKAAKRIISAIKNNEKIAIHGDFDVDGVTATTIMWRYLYRDLGADVTPFIPNRFNDGYGLSKNSLDAIVKSGADLVVTVDCGVKDVELIHKYSKKLDFIITDHHSLLSEAEVDNTLPYVKKIGSYYISKDASAVVHPKLGNSYPFDEICGAAVSWKVCCEINDQLSNATDMNKYIDLVALGTVCDVMPLYNENRSLVKFGIDQMKNTHHVGLQSLIDISGNYGGVDEYTLGFQIGPRINAAGRLEDALHAVKLLSTDDATSAQNLANHLNTLNIERQNLTKEYISKAEEQIEQQKDNLIYTIVGDEWPEGIVGLIAGKMTDKYSRPVLVGSSSNGVIKGSARSIETFDISLAFKLLDDHLIAHGGHVQAAGFTVKKDKWKEFSALLQEYGSNKIEKDDLEKRLLIDAILDLQHVTSKTISDLKKLEPYGQANPKPLFGFLDLSFSNVQFFSENKHVKFLVSDASSTLPVIGFGLGEYFNSLQKNCKKIDIAGTLFIDTFNNRNIPTLKIKEIRPA